MVSSMAKKGKERIVQEAQLIDKVKRWGVQAMFSDDELLDELVLKGGNAIFSDLNAPIAFFGKASAFTTLAEPVP